MSHFSQAVASFNNGRLASGGDCAERYGRESWHLFNRAGAQLRRKIGCYRRYGATSIVVAILMKSAYCKWALEHALALEWYCSSLRHYASNH